MEKLTGVSAHSIRKWESRHELFQPVRDESGCRRYTEEDLDLLKAIVLLRADGMRISKIAALSREEIDACAEDCCRKVNGDHQHCLEQTLSPWRPAEFEKWLTQRIERLGIRDTIRHEVFALQRKLQFMLLSKQISSVQVRYIDQIIERKLYTELDKLKKRKSEQIGRALIFYPQGIMLRSILLYVEYLMERSGFDTMNVGQLGELSQLSSWSEPEPIDLAICLLTEHFSSQPAEEYARALKAQLPESRILFAGYQSRNLNPCPRCAVFGHIQELIDYIETRYAGITDALPQPIS